MVSLSCNVKLYNHTTRKQNSALLKIIEEIARIVINMNKYNHNVHQNQERPRVETFPYHITIKLLRSVLCTTRKKGQNPQLFPIVFESKSKTTVFYSKTTVVQPW